MKSGMVSFEDCVPNVKANSLPAHGNASVNMVDGCQGNFRVFDVRHLHRSLVEMHRTLCIISDCEHDYDGCAICSTNPHGCMIVKRDIQRLMDENVIQIQQSRDIYDVNVIVLVFKIPERVVIQFDSSNNNNNVNRSVSTLVIVLAGPVSYASNKVVPYQYNATMVENGPEVPLLVADSMVNIVDIAKLDHIVANITSRNNRSFYDEELPEEGRNHNLALYISRNCKEDALSNVLVNTGSSLNVLPKSTLSKLSYQVAPMRYIGIIVKAFDGSRKTVIGEVDLPNKIEAVTSTLHQKLKFVKNDKLVVVGGEKELLVIHMSSFSYVEAEEKVGTLFQALSIAEVKKTGVPMSSLKDPQKDIETGSIDQWGRMIDIAENKNRVGLGFQPGSFNVKAEDVCHTPKFAR
ncbi:hypothetical protein KIW84_022915 [Lathyrus oleraceus]|uniref:Uncharacterized protein n=1 Tax=Pisum sativum TaxID=3888 RepID=A0A9D4YCE1_PEA|nr:hypothetical protein KIW84_022915 [Pisum sativum]